ncbi:MAG: ATP synthase F1 subunit delta [Bacteroidota bacterium]
MNEHMIAERYAKSFFNILQMHKMLHEGNEDMQQIVALIRESSLFRSFLNNPLYTSQARQKLVSKLLKEKITPLTLHFLLLVIKKKRIAYLQVIAVAFIDLYHKNQQTGKALIELAHPIFSTTLEKSLVIFIKKITGWKAVQLSVLVNPELVGGYILTFKNKRLDASFRARLQQLKNVWTKSPR